MKLHTTHVFAPTEFKRHKPYHHMSAEKALQNLFTVLDGFCESLELETEQCNFLGVPAGLAADYFQWRRKKGVETREIKLPPGAAGALNDLYYAICYRLQQEYEAGLADGTDLLRRLASGEITAQQVDAVKR